MQMPTAGLGEFSPPNITDEQIARVRAFEAAESREKWRKRLREAGIPKRFQSAPRSALDGAVSAYIDAFTEETDRGLLLTGPYGCGKTTAACAILARVAKAWPVVFATMPEVVEQAATFERDALSRYRNTRLLCLDDLGKERPTEFAMEQVYSVIDFRWREGKPTIITTNYTQDELFTHFTKVADKHTANAVMSRILGMCDIVRLGGRDRRLA